MERTGKLHEDDVGYAPVTAGSAGAVGKRSRVELELTPRGAGVPGPAVAGGNAGPSDPDRIADLASRAGAAAPRGRGRQAFPAPANASPNERHDAAAARLQLIEDS